MIGACEKEWGGEWLGLAGDEKCTDPHNTSLTETLDTIWTD